MRIGEVARLSGCSPETIRHYEKLGLLAPPARTANGYREYSVEAAQRLGFIRNGRALGLDLDTISELLALIDQPEADCATANRIAEHHLEVVERRIESLQRLAGELRTVVAQCRGGRAADCSIIDALFPADMSTARTADAPTAAAPREWGAWLSGRARTPRPAGRSARGAERDRDVDDGEQDRDE